ncbi:MAG: helix-hairpin-helix domain-containing protein [Dysgonamonadaceae bacterium]|nr:helix-hairpin-helix domain-containing protein [Dysgonamonadaceae bacterium]
MKPILTLALALTTAVLTAQPHPDNTAWMQYIEELAASDERDENDAEQLFDELSHLSNHPFNLHAVAKKDLERLPFLSDIQIENLLHYLHKYSPLVDIYELKNVETLDMQTIARLLPFVCIGNSAESPDPRRNNIFRRGKREIMIRSDYTLQQKAGYRIAAPEEIAAHPNKHYLGEPYYLSLRYGFNAQDIQWGFAAEKDAGEPFWNSRHKGFDHYAFNVNLKNRGMLDNLHIGDYRLSFGQGLVMNTNFSPGKMALITRAGQASEGIKRHASTNETGFFRGIAAVLKFNHLQLALFYSHRKRDANADSAVIRSFKTDGYHRIPSDVDKRGTVAVNMGGARVSRENESLKLGLTVVYYTFGGKRFNPDPKPYLLFRMREKNHFNAGADYGFKTKRLSFTGETAVDAAGKWATVNNLALNPAAAVGLTFSYRNYARDYNAFYAKAFSEASGVGNETGFYAGVKLQPFSSWELSAYVDCFRFPWLRYGVDAPSSGVDGLAQIAYQPRENLQLQLRYKYREKEKNAVDENDNRRHVSPYRQQRGQFRIDYFSDAWALKMQADYHFYADGSPSETGWALTQTVGFAPDPSAFRIDGGASYFHTDGWNSRINIYEKHVLYAFYYPVLYGAGLRFHALVKWKIAASLTVYFKAAHTRYFDRDVISSGLEEIRGRDKTDVCCLLRCVF